MHRFMQAGVMMQNRFEGILETETLLRVPHRNFNTGNNQAKNQLQQDTICSGGVLCMVEKWIS